VSAAPLPNFLVIGAQRSATSWLYFCLKEHPDVYVPYIKEVRYFSDYYANGPEWYARYFSQWSGQMAVGEVTPNYLYREGTAERIAKDLPGAKLIVTLRDPVERAYSQYKKHVRAGLTLSFEESLEKDPEYTERGLYLGQLLRYEHLFPKKNILILFYEDIQKDPKHHMKRILEFIGVDASNVPPSTIKIIPSEELASGLYKHTSRVSGFLRNRLGMAPLVDAVKRSKLMPAIDRMLYRFGPKAKGKNGTTAREASSMRPETREKLKRTFEPENRRLAEHLGRDLGFWK